jgi:hypothetical protein
LGEWALGDFWLFWPWFIVVMAGEMMKVHKIINTALGRARTMTVGAAMSTTGLVILAFGNPPSMMLLVLCTLGIGGMGIRGLLAIINTALGRARTMTVGAAMSTMIKEG